MPVLFSENKSRNKLNFFKVFLLFTFFSIIFFSININTVFATAYRTKITIDHTQVPNTDQTDFPVLIKRTETGWKTITNGGHVGKDNGGDIYFTLSDGTTKLDHEIESYSSSTGELIAWVKIPTLSSSVNTDIYAYYGDRTAPDQWNIPGTWDDGGNNYFKGVWHFENGTVLSATDSTGNGNNGTITSTPAIDGQIDGGANFLNSSSMVGIPSISLASGVYTVSTWFKTPFPTTGYTTLIRGNADHQILVEAGSRMLGGYDNAGGTAFHSSGFNMSTLSDGWHYLTGVASSSDTIFYIDGNPVGTMNWHSTADVITLGNYQGGGQQWGSTDELRIATGISRSSDWIKTEYNNQNSPESFTSVTAEERIGALTVPSVPVGFNVMPGNTQASLSWTTPVDDGGAVITDYVVEYKLTSTSTWSIFADGVSTSTNATVTGLTIGLSYDFRVSAVNSVGQGNATDIISAAPTIFPGSYRTKITIDHTKVSNTDQLYFPVLINKTDANFKTTANGGHVGQEDGGDIVFTLADGVTKLDHEIESYSSSTGEIVAWVKIPTLSASVDTDIYMYYGNVGGSNQWNIPGTWDDGGNNYFKGVWHLGDAGPTNVYDSTSNNNNGTQSGGLTFGATGKMDGAASFAGSQYVDISDSPFSFDRNNTFSISAWVNTSFAGAQSIVGKMTNGSPFTGYDLEITNIAPLNHPVLYLINSYPDNTIKIDGTAIVNDGQWHHIVATYDGSSDASGAKMYIDGVESHTTVLNSLSSSIINNNDLRIGSRTGGEAFNGLIDETRISSVVRSADWIKTEYNNQNSTTTFYSINPEETLTTPDVPNNLTTAGSNSQASLSWLPPTLLNDRPAITDYVIEYKLSTDSSWSIFADGVSTTTNATVTGLTNGLSYDFRVSAVNIIGQGNPSNVSSVTPLTIPWYNTVGGYRTKIILDHTKVFGNQANFPVLINQTDPNWKDTTNGGHVGQANGGDILFTSADGATKLDHEIESYSSSTGELIAWVKIPNLSSSVDTNIYMYYGDNAVANQQNISGTWNDGSGNYLKGVWHFEDGTTLSATDSTGNGNNGTITDSLATSGQIDGAANFSVSSSIVSIPDIPLISGVYTVSTWFKTPFPTTGYGSNTLIRGAYDHQIIVFPDSGGRMLGIYQNAGGSGFHTTGFDMNTLPDGWHYLSAVTSGSGMIFYVDGNPVGTTNWRSTDGIDYLGNYQGTSQQWGNTDELRIATGISRSANWIKTEYSNQNSPATFSSLNGEERIVLPNAPSALLITPGNTFASLSWTAPIANDGPNIFDYVIEYKPSTASSWSVFSDPVSTTTSGVVTGLTNGVSYDFRVSAVNAVGQGNASNIASAVLVTLPSAPIIGTAVAGNATATVSFMNLSTPWYDNAWTHRKKITIDHTKVYNSDQIYFPVLINQTDPDWKDTANGGHVGESNGGDILFTTADGLTKLNHEIESYSSSTGELVAWVKVPKVSTSIDTNLYIYYGNASASNQWNISGTWDEGGANYFKGVWHFNDPTNPVDSTVNANDGTNYGTTLAIGKMGGAAHVESGAYIQDSTASGLPVGANDPWTMEQWINLPTTPGGLAVMSSFGVWNGVGQIRALMNYSGGIYFWGWNSDFGTGVPFPTGEWSHIVFSYSGTTLTIYLNGNVIGTQAITLADAVEEWKLGASYWGIQWTGDNDEMRISSTARSINWIKTEYNNQNSPSTFYSVMPEENFITSASNGGSEITNYTVTSDPGTIVGTGTSSPITLIGLTNGTTYTFTVTATNELGTGPASSSSNPIIPATVPDAPTAVSAIGGDSQVSLLWNAPAFDGGNAITDYTIEYKLNSTSTWSIFADGVSPATTTIVTGLINGSLYDFRISAVNPAGQGNASNVVNGTPLTVPDAPTTIFAVRGNTQVTVSFVPPISNGGSDITNYTVTSSPDGQIGTGTSSPIIVTGLTNGTLYTFTVTATNSAGTGSSSVASNTVTPATVPDAPTSPVSTAGNAQAQVTFVPPVSNGGSNITSYVVTSNPEGKIGTGNNSPIIVAGLTNGTPYTFSVTAINDVGTSSPSVASNSVTPVTVPGAPIIGTSTAGNAQAQVTFTPPGVPWYNSNWTHRTKITIDHNKVMGDLNNFPVLINEINPDWKDTANGGHVGQPDGGDIVFTTADGSTKLDHEIEKYVSSTGEVVAWIKVPTVSASTDTNIYMYYSNASVADQWSINNTWNDGGSNYYKGVWHLKETGTNPIVYDSTANANNSTVQTWTPTDGQIDGAGSFNGSSQYINVSSSNFPFGSSPRTVSFWTYPTRSTGDQGFVGYGNSSSGNLYDIITFNNGKISLHCYACNSGYADVSYAPDAWNYVTFTYDGTVNKIYINGILKDTDNLSLNTIDSGVARIGWTVYDTEGILPFQGSIDDVRVSSIVRSDDWIKTEYNNQNSPSTFYQLANEEIVSNPKLNDGGSTITNYIATANPGGLTATGSTSPITITGLTNGTYYTFVVAAINSVGTGPNSADSNSVKPMTVPNPPTTLTPTAGNGQVSLTWIAPVINGGSNVTDYVIEYKLTSTSTWSTFADSVSDSTNGLVVGLTNGLSYDFRVSAVNLAGQGSASSEATAVPVTVPDAPTGISATPSNASAVVTFTPPVSNGGSSITSYTVTSSPGNYTGTGTSSPIIVTGLTNGTSYTFTVTATNAVGTGSISSSSNSVIPVTVPDAPTGVAATEGNRQATVSFVPPASNGGSAITSYTVTSSPGNYTGTGTSSPIIITGLTNGTSYTFTVTATNNVGTGSASSPSNSVRLSTEPDSPVNLAAIVSGSSIGLTWSAPALNGGTAITDYVIEYKLTTGGTWSVFSDAISVSTTATVTGLANNTSYDFRVSAVNIIGQSLPSNSVTAIPGEPAQVLIQSFSDLTATTIGTNVRITNEGSSEYEYQYVWCITDSVTNLCGGGDDIFSGSNAKLIQPHENYDTTINSIVPTAGNYWFHINVNYGSNMSTAYQSFTAVATYPDAPTTISATQNNAAATITFTPPISNGGSNITNYTITSSPGGLTANGNSSPITITGLTNGTSYTFTVTATNAVGTSPISSSSNSVIPMTVPDAPTSIGATAGNTIVTLSWTAPISNGGSPITDYVVEYKPASDSIWSVFADGISTSTTVTVTGLTNNVSYNFRVSAVNSVGQSLVNSTSTTLSGNNSTNTSGSHSGQYTRSLPSGQIVTTSTTSVINNISTTTKTKVVTPTKVKTTKPTAGTPAQVVTPTTTTSSTKVNNEITATPVENPVVLPTINTNNTGGGVSWITIIMILDIIFILGFIIFILYRTRWIK